MFLTTFLITSSFLPFPFDFDLDFFLRDSLSSVELTAKERFLDFLFLDLEGPATGPP